MAVRIQQKALQWSLIPMEFHRGCSHDCTNSTEEGDLFVTCYYAPTTTSSASPPKNSEMSQVLTSSEKNERSENTKILSPSTNVPLRLQPRGLIR